MRKVEYFRAFSIPLLRFLKANGQRAVSKSVHKVTGKTYWVFVKDAEFERLLGLWTKGKDRAIKNDPKNQ